MTTSLFLGGEVRRSLLGAIEDALVPLPGEKPKAHRERILQALKQVRQVLAEEELHPLAADDPRPRVMATLASYYNSLPMDAHAAIRARYRGDMSDENTISSITLAAFFSAVRDDLPPNLLPAPEGTPPPGGEKPS